MNTQSPLIMTKMIGPSEGISEVYFGFQKLLP